MSGFAFAIRNYSMTHDVPFFKFDVDSIINAVKLLHYVHNTILVLDTDKLRQNSEI